MRTFAPDVAAALLLVLGCAGDGSATRRETDALRAEVRALRRDSDDLARKLDALASRVEVISARLARAGGDAARDEQRTPEPAPPVIPPDLAVVHVVPQPKGARPPPPVPTAVPIAEPDPERLDEIARPGPGRGIAAEAEAELRRARARSGAERAHALEDFAARYPRHPSADNALVEAAAAYAESGRGNPACDLARRASEEYPAGDAMSDALERLAWCESRRGAVEAERRLLERLVADFPRTPAAERAGTRLARLSGQTGATPDASTRSGP